MSIGLMALTLRSGISVTWLAPSVVDSFSVLDVLPPRPLTAPKFGVFSIGITTNSLLGSNSGGLK
tara:strand:- start:7958 stop:8152 length:195 start_codon:yes stop_codon:yes gene_type:complete